MENKQKKIKIAILVILSLTLIVIIVLSIVKKRNISVENNHLNNNNQNEEKKPINKISCVKELTSENYYKLYDLVDVENEIAKEKNSLFKIVYKNEDNYKGFKSNESDLQNPKFDDENLTIIYDHDGKIDLSKDPEGENIEIPYTNTIDELESEGYSCSLD